MVMLEEIREVNWFARGTREAEDIPVSSGSDYETLRTHRDLGRSKQVR